MPIFAQIGGTEGYWLVFITLLLDGWFSGVVQTLTYQENAKLPGAYIGIFLTSQGLAGVSSNALRFASLEIWPDQPFVSVAFNYIFCVIVCLLCIPAQIALNKNPFAQQYQKSEASEAYAPVVVTDGTKDAEDGEIRPEEEKALTQQQKHRGIGQVPPTCNASSGTLASSTT